MAEEDNKTERTKERNQAAGGAVSDRAFVAVPKLRLWTRPWSSAAEWAGKEDVLPGDRPEPSRVDGRPGLNRSRRFDPHPHCLPAAGRNFSGSSNGYPPGLMFAGKYGFLFSVPCLLAPVSRTGNHQDHSAGAEQRRGTRTSGVIAARPRPSAARFNRMNHFSGWLQRTGRQRASSGTRCLGLADQGHPWQVDFHVARTETGGQAQPGACPDEGHLGNTG